MQTYLQYVQLVRLHHTILGHDGFTGYHRVRAGNNQTAINTINQHRLKEKQTCIIVQRFTDPPSTPTSSFVVVLHHNILLYPFNIKTRLVITEVIKGLFNMNINRCHFGGQSSQIRSTDEQIIKPRLEIRSITYIQVVSNMFSIQLFYIYVKESLSRISPLVTAIQC